MTNSSAVASTRVRCGTARRSPRRHGFPAPIPSARATGRSSPSMIPTVIRGWSRRSQRGTPAACDRAFASTAHRKFALKTFQQLRVPRGGSIGLNRTVQKFRNRNTQKTAIVTDASRGIRAIRRNVPKPSYSVVAILAKTFYKARGQMGDGNASLSPRKRLHVTQGVPAR